MASVPHNYMIGAFVYGRIAGENAVDYLQSLDHLEPDPDFLAAEQARLYPPSPSPTASPTPRWNTNCAAWSTPPTRPMTW